MTYEKKYVRKKRNKIIASVCIVASLIGIGAYTTISYLGRLLGNFTIGVNGNTYLTMSEDKEFTAPTSYLRAKNVDGLYLMNADDLPNTDAIDNSTLSGSHNGVRDKYENGEKVGTEDLYFAYTFYVKNVGSKDFEYGVNLKINEVSRPSNVSISPLEYVRLRIYQNRYDSASDDTHNVATYAKRTNQTYALGGGKEPISKYKEISLGGGSYFADFSDNIQDINKDYSTEFINDTYVVKDSMVSIQANEIYRYTVIMWLEGNDKDSDTIVPEGSSIKFSMSLDSY